MTTGRTRLTVAVIGALGLLLFQGSPAAQSGAVPSPPAAPGLPPGLPPEFAALMMERPLVRQFDTDGNGRLETEERKGARTWLATQPPAGLAGLLQKLGVPGGVAAITAGRKFPQPAPGRRLTPADVTSGGAAPLYDRSTLRTIFLEFDNADWEKELAAFYNTDVEVPATVTLDGTTYRDVGVHFRGMSSFMFVPEGLKRSLNLAADFVHEDQRILGYRTLNLLNGNGDPTMVRALLYSEIARNYVPAPKMNYLRVAINGESWGVKISAQQFNSDFINEWFNTRRGARWRVPGSPFGQAGMQYLGDSPDAYKALYSIRTRDDDRSWSDLIRMFRVLNQTPLDRLEAELSPLLDIDNVLKFLALEIVLVNSDGYWVRASDYNIYQDEKGRFHLIPHDINEALAEEAGPPPGPPPGFPAGFQLPALLGRATAELDPLVGLDDPTKPLRSRLLAVPALRERYLRYVREIADRWLDWNTLEPLVRQYHGMIAPEVKTDTRRLYTYEEFEQGVSGSTHSLKNFVDRRRAFLLQWKPSSP